MIVSTYYRTCNSHAQKHQDAFASAFGFFLLGFDLISRYNAPQGIPILFFGITDPLLWFFKVCGHIPYGMGNVKACVLCQTTQSRAVRGLRLGHDRDSMNTTRQCSNVCPQELYSKACRRTRRCSLHVLILSSKTTILLTCTLGAYMARVQKLPASLSIQKRGHWS